MLKKFTVFMLILILSISHTIHATEGISEESFHSLEELPFGDTPDMRAGLLEGDIVGDVPLPNPETSSYTDTTESEKISFASDDSFEGNFMTLLSEKRVFEIQEKVLMPEFITDPFTHNILSQGTPLSLFSFFPENQTGIILESHMMQGIQPEEIFDTIFPHEKKQVIEVNRKIKNQRKIDTTRGDVTVEISSGTVIRTLSGDIIDTALIDITSLDSAKKFKAKSKYEKKMKNRGSIRKGQAEAQVEGFEFGLSGTHLIFSQPVKISLTAPNMGEGMVVDLLTLHAGDTDFHTGGLSVSPNMVCNSDGSSSTPLGEVIVKNGKVTFYTCGASSFTMNPSGGTTGSNDLRAIIGDCAQIQLYYNNLTQIYTGAPPGTGCSIGGTMDAWPVLRIGATSYGNDFTAWSTNTTTGSTAGNTYTATSTMTRVVGGLTYTLIIDWSHTAPNKYLTWSWRVVVPATNAQNVRFYYGMDSAVAGGDTNDVGYLTSTGGLTFGVYDSTANVLSAFRYMSGQAWTAYEAGPLATVRGRISGGTNFANTITASADLGYGINWDFGTTPGTYSGTLQWTLAPYVAANVPDLIPGIGQPEGPLAASTLSQLPITVTNVGNASSSGVHTIVFTVPTNITGPASPFVDNGWSCGAQVGTGVTCTKTTIVSTPLGTDTLRIPVTPTLAASGTSVTFNVALTNPGDSNTTNNTAFATNSVVGGVPAVDAGGIAGESLWLQANNNRTNCTTQGCTITTWTNIGGLGAAANAVTGVGTATYDSTNSINGHPTVYFNNATLNTNSTLNISTAAASVFAVTKLGSGGAFLIGPQTAVNNSLEWATTPTQDRWKLYNGTVFYSGANLRAVATPAITSSIRQAGGASANSTNGLQTLTGALPATAFVGANIGIGRFVNTYSSLTNLAEVITFPTTLSAVQKNQVESYFAIKYAITLDQTTQTSYSLSNNIIAWSATGAGVFNKNIAGIARDDISTLNQNRSQSITNTGDIIVSKTAIATNRLALMWGNDAGSTTSFTGLDVPTGYQRISREWQFQEKNGDLGTITVAYPSASVPAGFTGTLMLLVDSDGVFDSGALAYTGTLSGSNWEFSLNISDMQYITLAKTVSTDLTPPIISGVNIASGTLIPSSNFTIIANFSDTGSAINPGSFSGRIYAWDSTGSTWNLTNIAPSYMSITGTTTASTGQLRVSEIPFGKYRFDLVIADTFGNTLIQSYTYFIDAVEWTVSAPLYPIGVVPLGSNTFGSGELIITIQTVGAGFDLSMMRTTDLTYLTEVISVYDGVNGWGYDKNIGSGYSSTITAHGSSQNIVSIAKNINPNGQRNTFTYRVKYGMNISSNTSPGDYLGNIQFAINLTY